MSDLNRADPPEEPLLNVGAITTAAAALIALIVAFGAPVNDDQQAAILAAIAVVAPVIVALVGRGKVYAPATVKWMVEDARKLGQR